MFKATAKKRMEGRISAQSGPLAAREILADLMSLLTPQKLPFDDASKIELVVAEAINNIVEHAYPPGAPDGPIDLDVRRNLDKLHFTITDQGLGMPDGKAPSGRPQNVKVDLLALPEGGFGWFLIRDQAENVEYTRTAWENCLSFDIPLSVQNPD